MHTLHEENSLCTDPKHAAISPSGHEYVNTCTQEEYRVLTPDTALVGHTQSCEVDQRNQES